MVTYIGLKQENGTHDNFVCRLRDSASLVEMAFEDSGHPGFISLNVLQKCIYLNGLDPVQFERPIIRLFEDKPSTIFAEALLICQEHEMSKRVINKSELLPDNRALAAVISTPVKSVFNGPQKRHAEAALVAELRVNLSEHDVNAF